MLRSKKINTIFIIILIAAIAGISIYIFWILNRKDLAPEDSAALYGGQLETRFPYVGYVQTVSSSFIYLCGINYLSSTVGVSAAHCFAYEGGIFANTGLYEANFQSTGISGNYTLYPGYNGDFSQPSTIDKDIAVLSLSGNVNISEFATIATPNVGCNYYITGYGKSEGDVLYRRMGGQVCISQVFADRIILTKTSGFAYVCPGDSGSGIYELGTNRIVGVVSSINALTCQASTAFFGVRLDSKLSFFSQFLPNITPSSTPTPTANLCPSNKNTQFWINCLGDEYAGCGGLDGWLSGSEIEVINPTLPFTLDINCFANNGGIFPNSRIALYKDEVLISSSDTNKLSDYNITQSGLYSARCIDKSIASCQDIDRFTLNNSPTIIPTLTPTTQPTQTILPTITSTPTIVPTSTPTPVFTQTATPIPALIPTSTAIPTATIIPTSTFIPTSIIFTPTNAVPSSNPQTINPTNVIINQNIAPNLPNTAINQNSILLLIFGAILVYFGFWISMKSHKVS